MIGLGSNYLPFSFRQEVKDHSSGCCLHRDRLNVRGGDVAKAEVGDVSPEEAAQSTSSYQQCVICLEEYTIGEEVSWSKHLMDCPHVYHPTCIKQWLSNHSGCPCCRSRFIDKRDKTVVLCCGPSVRKSEQVRLREIIDERRKQGEFCIVHGLVFPQETRLRTRSRPSTAVTALASSGGMSMSSAYNDSDAFLGFNRFTSENTSGSGENAFTLSATPVPERIHRKRRSSTKRERNRLETPPLSEQPLSEQPLSSMHEDASRIDEENQATKNDMSKAARAFLL